MKARVPLALLGLLSTASVGGSLSGCDRQDWLEPKAQLPLDQFSGTGSSNIDSPNLTNDPYATEPDRSDKEADDTRTGDRRQSDRRQKEGSEQNEGATRDVGGAHDTMSGTGGAGMETDSDTSEGLPEESGGDTAE